MRELTYEPARLLQRLRTLRATARQVRFDYGAVRRVKRAKGVGFDQLPEFVVGAHNVACKPSFKRINPLRIQLFTVPKGSFREAAISEWLKPSK